jgi:hypothetical protein
MTHEEFLDGPEGKYSDWFGEGSNKLDYASATAEHGLPSAVYQSGHMLALVYDNKIVITGYDGNEYCHTFVFPTGV